MQLIDTSLIPADHLLEARQVLDLLKREVSQRGTSELIESLERTEAMVGALLARVLN